MTTRAPHAFALLALLLAGCAAPIPVRDPAPPAPDPECAGIGSWWEPQLYPALARVPGHTQRGPNESIPFNTTRIRVGGPAALLTLLAHRDGRDMIFLHPENGTRIAAVFTANTTEERARAIFDAFVANVSGGGADFDAFWASREGRDGIYAHELPLNATLRLEELWETLDRESRGEHRYAANGMRATWPGWEARFEFPERRVETKAKDEALVLYASGSGYARAMAPQYHPEAEAQSRIREAYARLDLDPPKFEGWERSGDVC